MLAMEQSNPDAPTPAVAADTGASDWQRPTMREFVWNVGEKALGSLVALFVAFTVGTLAGVFDVSDSEALAVVGMTAVAVLLISLIIAIPFGLVEGFDGPTISLEEAHARVQKKRRRRSSSRRN